MDFQQVLQKLLHERLLMISALCLYEQRHLENDLFKLLEILMMGLH